MVTLRATNNFVQFALDSRPASFPEKARTMATDAITDLLGCMIAGGGEPLSEMLGEIVFDVPVSQGAPLAVSGRSASPHDSALYNGALAHAIDYDDVTHPAYAHPGASIVPAVFATAAFEDISGAEALSAYILGIEMVSKLGRALNTAHYKNGWHASATFGTMGAAATAAAMLRLDADAYARSLALAASAASGLRANFGTMTKPLHVGYAARNAVLAALMARAGVSASTEILEHPYGFAEVFNHHGDIDWPQFETSLELWPIDIAVMIENLGEAIGVLKYLCAGGNSCTRHQCGEDSIPRGIAHMKRFCHGAKIGAQTARCRRRQSQGSGIGVRIKAQHRGCGRCGTHGSECGTGMPTVLIMRRVKRTAEFADHFDTEDIGTQRFRTGDVLKGGRGEDRRYDGCTWMGVGGVGHVIIVDSVGQGAVIKGAIMRGGGSPAHGERCALADWHVEDDFTQHFRKRLAATRDHAAE